MNKRELNPENIMSLAAGLDNGIAAITRNVLSGERISPAEALALWDAPLALVGALATHIRERLNGDAVYYNRNVHIEPTNICVFNCSFCSYRRAAESPEAWLLSMDDIERIAASHAGKGLTEVHIVGGVHPDFKLEDFIGMISRVKRALPGVTVKAFTAVELDYIISAAQIPLDKGLAMLKEAGMEAIPGGGAEIFDETIRERICPEKGSSARWLEVHAEAHRLGISTNATMLYGHVESTHHRIDHMDRLRRLQDETGGFNAFIPLKYRSVGNRLSHIGETSVTDDLRTLAMSRIYLDNFPHIKAYWPMFGKTTTGMALAFGADDIDGTIDDTTRIYSMAGAEDSKPSMTVEEIRRMAAGAGYRAVERDTFYNPVKN